MSDFRSAIENVRDELFVDTADGAYLDAIGENFGVFRPRAGIDDTTWRAVLRLVMMASKTTAERLEAILDALLGDTLRIAHAGDPRTAAPELRVEVVLDATLPAAVEGPEPPATIVRLTGPGLPADALRGPGPAVVEITAGGVRVGRPGSPGPAPLPGPERVVASATGGQTSAQLAHAPVQPGSIELWVRTPASATPVALSPADFGADPEGRLTFDVLPAPLTFLAPDPATGAPIPRPGLPAGAEVLASYVIDTRTYAGLAAALRLKLPPVFTVTFPPVSRARAWTKLQGADHALRRAGRIDLRSWSVHDVGRAPGPPDEQPTTPHADRTTVGPRVFVDLLRRADVARERPDPRQASYLHDDLRRPAPGAPGLWAVHPWNASGDPARLSTDRAFPGPNVYTFDERLQPCGRERVPGDPATWEPFPTEFATVLAHDPRAGQAEPVDVRQDRFATNPFSGSPLETIPGSGILYADVARPRAYAPRPDRSDHPMVLFADDLRLRRVAELVDLVRAAGVFVTFERGPERAPTAAPPWFCDPCYTTELLTGSAP